MNNLPTLHEIKMKLVDERLQLFAGNARLVGESQGRISMNNLTTLHEAIWDAGL